MTMNQSTDPSARRGKSEKPNPNVRRDEKRRSGRRTAAAAKTAISSPLPRRGTLTTRPRKRGERARARKRNRPRSHRITLVAEVAIQVSESTDDSTI